MAIKVYGAALSTCTKRVLATLEEMKVPYELITIDMGSGAHKSEEYLRKQTFGKIPYIDDNGLILYESRAIAKYIATKYTNQGTKLAPAAGDFEAYALFEQAASIETSYFNPAAEGLVLEKVFKKFRGLDADEDLVKKHIVDLDATLAVYDGILAKQTYIAGSEFSVADIFHLPYGSLAKVAGAKDIFAKYRNVTRWFDALEVRESWAKVSA